MLEITYVYHNCFIIKWNNKSIVFDYPEILGDKEEDLIRKEVADKELAVLITHSHSDHFSEKFLDLRLIAKNFTCTVSFDVAKKSSKCAKECLVVNERALFKIWDAEVKAYGSSDLGVSYLLKINGHSIYFAGDNADWRRKELPPQINRLVWDVFSKTISKIRDEHGKIDIVLIDLCEICKNLGGILHIVNTLRPKLIVPMHLHGNTKLLERIMKMLSLNAKVFLYDRLGDKIMYPSDV